MYSSARFRALTVQSMLSPDSSPSTHRITNVDCICHAQLVLAPFRPDLINEATAALPFLLTRSQRGEAPKCRSLTFCPYIHSDIESAETRPLPLPVPLRLGGWPRQ